MARYKNCNQLKCETNYHFKPYTVLFLHSLTFCGQVLKVWYILCQALT